MSRIDWSLYDHRLGVDMDTIIAEEAGCSRELVRQHRNRLCIPPPKKVSRKPAPEWVDLLGKQHDAAIARTAGVSLTTIGDWRRKLSIPTVPRKTYTKSMFDAVTDEQWRTMTFDAIAKMVGATQMGPACRHYWKHKRHIQRIDGRSKGRAA